MCFIWTFSGLFKSFVYAYQGSVYVENNSVGRCMQALASLLSKAQHCFSTVVVLPQLHGLTGIVGRKYSAVNPYHTAKIYYKVVCEGGGQQDINQSTREFG